MTAATLQIDLDVLDELFNNQKRLDDVKLFEDDFLFGSSSATPVKTHIDNHGSETTSEDLSFMSADNFANFNSRSLKSFIIPLTIEIVAIYYGIQYFN